MARNYYVILGIRTDANPDEIKAAFRQRALELHPDKSGLNSSPFIEAQEAYLALSDPQRRRAYDRQLNQPAIAPASAVRDIALNEFETYYPSFDELFDRLWSNFLGVSRPKTETPESLTLEIILTPDEARTGGRVRVEVPAQTACPTCGGHGHVAGYGCWRCAGHGALTGEYPVDIDYPAGIRDGHVMQLSLAQFGLHNFYLTVQFRATGNARR